MVRFTKRDLPEKELLLNGMADVNEDPIRPINDAFQHVRESIEYIDGTSGINETDLIFLKGLMDSPIMKNLVKVQDKLEDLPLLPKPIRKDAKGLVEDLSTHYRKSRNRELKELLDLISTRHFLALIDCHDEVARISENPKPAKADLSKLFPELNGMTGEAIRMVGVRKKDGEPLGLTVQLDDNGNLVIARILEGGMIEKQGLLHVGDVILEVNGTPVGSAEDLQTEVAKSKDSVTLKVGQPKDSETHASLVMNGSANEVSKKLTCYMRALFEYIPEEDTLLPCKEIGLPFDRGDILQIVDQRDPNWWQAKKVGGDGRTGLVPSLELEERRKAFVAPEADFVHKISICGARISKKKKKIIYQSKSNCEFDKAELLLYEEVTRMPPFKRKTLVLIGTQGVGRRTLKNRLINSDPEKFGGVVPYTSRPPRVLEENGQSYWFADRESIEEDIKQSKFLEYGEYNGHLYGTHLDSIRDVIRQGRMCILDCSPMALKILHNSPEFLPYVIFIAAPGMEQLKNLYDVGKSNSNLRYSSRNLTFERQSSIRYSSRRARTLESLASLYEEEDLKRTLEESASMQRTYDKYIDQVIVNNDFDVTFRQILEALDTLTTEHQWVPKRSIFLSGKALKRLNESFPNFLTRSICASIHRHDSLSSQEETMEEVSDNAVKKIVSVSRSTQFGNAFTADEENVVVMVKSYSPLRDFDALEETREETTLCNVDSDPGVFEPMICGGEKDKGKLTGTEKRKADDGEPNKDLKKAKLETKALKAKRPGFTDDRYNETSYYIENGLRKVYPYYFTFTTFTKGRWVGERILDVFAREFRAHPAEEYERCIQAGTLTVNYDKVPTDYKLKHNDLLANVVHRHEVPVTSQPITIVHMDEDIVVVNKPASIPVHPCGRYRHNTVVFILAKEYNLKNLRTIHRLDRLTSGLLLFGRSPKKARQMEHQIRNRLVQKEYVCRVEGEFPDEIIECKEPIEVVSYKIGVCKVSSKGKDCNTIFQKLGYNGKTSIVLCKPKTGRMHQIRVHLQYLGYPVVNDPLYNHEVFGPMKGKGGDLGGKTDEELVCDLIHIHNAENWLGMDGDSELSMFNPRKGDIDESLVGPLVPKDRVLGDDDADPVSREPSPCDESGDTSSMSCESSPHPLALSSLGAGRNADAKVTVATQTGHEAPDFTFNPDKMTVDKHCYECKVRYRDPKPQDLVMYLHAWKYRGPGWEFETELPDWARVDWAEPDVFE